MTRPDIILAVLGVLLGIQTLIKYKHHNLLAFFATSLLVEFMGYYYGRQGINNVLLFNLYSVFQFIYIMHCFEKILDFKLLGSLKFFLPLICLLNIFLIQGPNTFHTYSFMIGSLTVIVLAITYLWKLFNTGKVESLLKNARFWFAIAVLLYFTTSVSVIGIFNYIATLPKSLITLSRIILLTVNTLFYLLLLISMICERRTLRYTHSL